MGGNVVFVLGPKWRIHYYAHLKRDPNISLIYSESSGCFGNCRSNGKCKGKTATFALYYPDNHPLFLANG
jgi:hypothetical protein